MLPHPFFKLYQITFIHGTNLLFAIKQKRLADCNFIVSVLPLFVPRSPLSQTGQHSPGGVYVLSLPIHTVGWHNTAAQRTGTQEEQHSLGLVRWISPGLQSGRAHLTTAQLDDTEENWHKARRHEMLMLVEMPIFWKEYKGIKTKLISFMPFGYLRVIF